METAEQRVELLKKGFSGKEIEKLYIEYNNFKIIRSPILFDAFEFDFNQNTSASISRKVSIESAPFLLKNKRKTKSILILAIFLLILALLVPISTIFLGLLLLFLFVPPMLALLIIFIEGIVVISKELNRLPLPNYVINLNGNST